MAESACPGLVIYESGKNIRYAFYNIVDFDIAKSKDLCYNFAIIDKYAVIREMLRNQLIYCLSPLFIFMALISASKASNVFCAA